MKRGKNIFRVVMRNLQTLTVRRMNLGQSNHSISDFDNCPFFANSGGGGGGGEEIYCYTGNNPPIFTGH